MSNLKIDQEEFNRKAQHILDTVVKPQVERYEKAKAQQKNKMTAVEWFFKQLTEVDYGCINKTFLQNNNSLAGHKLRELLEQAKEMEKEQRGYSEEDVREMLFMALCEPQEECCTTHTKDSIVRKVLKTFNQLRLAEQLENEIDNL